MARGLAAWRRWWGDTEVGSQEMPVAFPAAFRGPLDYDPRQWQAAPGRPYGADVSRVAYTPPASP